MKGQKGYQEEELNEMETSDLSDIEFKVMFLRLLKELSENYNSIKKTIETMKKNSRK